MSKTTVNSRQTKQTPSGGNAKLIIAAVLVGIVFVILLNLQDMLEAKQRKDNTVTLALITADLQRGAILSQSNVRSISVPRSLLENVPALLEYDNIERGVTTVQRNVYRNDLLRQSDLVPLIDAEDTLGSRLSNNRQVISLAVDSRQPSAFLRSGSRVDVYGSLQGAGRTMLIIENLEVLSVDGLIDPNSGRQKFRSIEVSLPTELVANIKEVQRRSVGPLSISIRRPGDMTMANPYNQGRLEYGGAITKAAMDMISRSYRSTK